MYYDTIIKKVQKYLKDDLVPIMSSNVRWRNDNEKIIVAEDVITTGGSVNEVIDICKSSGAQIEAIISIIDRSSGVKFDFPYYNLIKLDIKKYLPSECPLCKSNLKIVYPGSKKQIPKSD